MTAARNSDLGSAGRGGMKGWVDVGKKHFGNLISFQLLKQRSVQETCSDVLRLQMYILTE